MYGADSAMIIELGKSMPKGGSKKGSPKGYEEEIEIEEVEEDAWEYSDEQHQMAEELGKALSSGDTQQILEAFHSIQMSY